MYRHGFKNTVTERLSTSHMLIVIEKTQSTFTAISSHVTIGGGRLGFPPGRLAGVTREGRELLIYIVSCT
jgi:hypothetical protein